MMPAFNIAQLVARTSLTVWHDPLQAPGMRDNAERITTALKVSAKPLTVAQLFKVHRCAVSRERCDAVIRVMFECGRLDRVRLGRSFAYSLRKPD